MPEVRHTLDKNGGRMADPGSVMFQFQRKGVIEIKETGEAALMAALDAGAEDAEEFGTGDGSSEEVAGGQTAEDDSEQGTEIITAPTDLMRVRQNLVDKGLTVTSAELKYIPTNKIELDDETGAKFSKLLDALDDLDDVTAVHTNAA